MADQNFKPTQRIKTRDIENGIAQDKYILEHHQVLRDKWLGW